MVFSWGGENHRTEKGETSVKCLRFPTDISMKISQIASASTSSTVAASHWSHNASCDIARPTQQIGFQYIVHPSRKRQSPFSPPLFNCACPFALDKPVSTPPSPILPAHPGQPLPTHPSRHPSIPCIPPHVSPDIALEPLLSPVESLKLCRMNSIKIKQQLQTAKTPHT